MSELDKTIEELEAEVQAELEEASHDAPKKGAAKGDSIEKADGVIISNGPGDPQMATATPQPATRAIRHLQHRPELSMRVPRKSTARR